MSKPLTEPGKRANQPAARPTHEQRPAVRYYEAKPNPLFTETQRAMIRFARYVSPTPCPFCGKLTRKHWTMLVPFGAVDVEKSFLVAEPSKETFSAGTPVCEDHPLNARPLSVLSRKLAKRRQ